MNPKLSNQERNRRRVFGQNFLIDDAVITDLVKDIGCSPRDRVIEIGPGNGALTRQLLSACAAVTAVEIDPKWVQHLKKKSEFSEVEIIQADAGRINIQELLKPDVSSSAKPVVVGNLPYNKAGPILQNFVPVLRSFRYMYVMVQYEVAKRMTASPHKKQFGALSVFIQNYAEPQLCLKIPPEAFRPKPRVFSATVKLKPRKKPLVEDPIYFQFVHSAFTQKRKMLVNSLKPVCRKNSVLEALQELKIPQASRPEDLSVQQFADLFGLLKEEYIAQRRRGAEKERVK